MPFFKGFANQVCSMSSIISQAAMGSAVRSICKIASLDSK